MYISSALKVSTHLTGKNFETDQIVLIMLIVIHLSFLFVRWLEVIESAAQKKTLLLDATD